MQFAQAGQQYLRLPILEYRAHIRNAALQRHALRSESDREREDHTQIRQAHPKK